MSFVTLTNILVMMLCIAVLVQSVRILRSFRNFNAVDLTATVTALDKSTAQARMVLSELKETLRTDCAGFARTLAESETLREELAMMIGIANAAAERIVETVDQQPRPGEAAPPPRKRRAGAEPKPERAAKRRPAAAPPAPAPAPAPAHARAAL
jgi:Domain of unknown function (DUF6468)